jgi:hypothetical protein
LPEIFIEDAVKDAAFVVDKTLIVEILANAKTLIDAATRNGIVTVSKLKIVFVELDVKPAATMFVVYTVLITLAS